MPKVKDIWTHLSETNKKIVMYGMGNGADKILSICAERNVEISDFFASDGFVRGHSFHGKRVLSYSETKEKYGTENMIVLLSFASSLPDVLENVYKIASECELYAPDVPVTGTNLFDLNFYRKNEEKIKKVLNLLADERSREVYQSVVNYKLSGDISYIRDTHSDFSEVYRDLLRAESFRRITDLGAYNGDTLREITPYAENLKEAYAFEPDRRNHKKLSDWAETEEKFKVNAFKLAAWDKNEILSFGGSGNRNSTLVTADSLPILNLAKTEEIEADSLDNILDGVGVDYIKYDVEGAEREALSGSHKTIEKYRPALFVSLYHRSEDIFELPLLIHKKYPDYKLYIRRRQYIPAWDTVLLAVKEQI